MLNKLFPTSLKTKFKLIAFKGNNVHCSVCDSSFITFMPFGIGSAPKRPNAVCPKCGALERTRIFWNYLQSHNILSGNISFFHVAPEQQFFERLKNHKNIKYIPVDKMEPGYVYPEGTMNMDITKIDLADNSVDFILCSHVLEHIPDDKLAMKELYRILKPGGKGILQVPMDTSLENTYENEAITDPKEREIHFGQYDHVRLYGLDYKSRLENAGFRVTLDDYAASASEHDKFKFGYGKGELLYVVSK
jgi:SAM-dependent methyltransferase